MLKPTVSYPDFAKLDMRVGKIIKTEEVEGSDKLQKLTVDLGEEIGKRSILAGIRTFFSTKELENKLVVVLVNLEPKKMLSEESQGMLIAADVDGRPVLLKPEEEVEPGTIIK